MKNSDLAARIAAVAELMAVLLNLFVAFIYFISLIWVLVGLLWGLVALGALIEGLVAVFVLVKGYSPVGIVGPLLGLGVSVCNLNFMGGMLEMLVLMVMIAALVLRQQEDAASAA